MIFGKIYFGIFLTCLVHYNVFATSIKAVAMLSRHGDRTPVATYPTDLYANSIGSYGLGMLTEKGQRQLHKSGNIKGARYAALLDEIDSSTPKNIYVLSSTSQRCIRSAQCFLGGFISNVFLQKVAINVPHDGMDDEILSTPGKPCSKYDQEFFDSLDFNQPETLTLTGGDQFIAYVTNHTRQEVSNMFDLFFITDNLIVNKNHQKSLPNWAQPIYEHQLKPLFELYFKYSIRSKRNQLRAGVLLNDILERFERYINGSTPKDILLYSAHDFTMTSLLSTLEILNQTAICPEYGAVLALELHNNVQLPSALEIKVFYFRNYADSDPLETVLPQCTKPCDYRQLKKVYSDRLVKNFDQECDN